MSLLASYGSVVHFCAVPLNDDFLQCVLSFVHVPHRRQRCSCASRVPEWVGKGKGNEGSNWVLVLYIFCGYKNCLRLIVKVELKERIDTQQRTDEKSEK